MTDTYLAFKPWLLRFLWWTRVLVKFCLIVWWHVWCDLGLDSTQLCSFTEAVTFNCKTTQQKGAELRGWNCTSKENELEHFRVRILISNYLSVDWQEFIPTAGSLGSLYEKEQHTYHSVTISCVCHRNFRKFTDLTCLFFGAPPVPAFFFVIFPSQSPPRPSKQHGKRRIPRVWALTSSNPWSTCASKNPSNPWKQMFTPP